MSAAQLISDPVRLGIRTEANGDRLRFAPRSAVTPYLTDQMKAYKDELLAILRRDSKAMGIDLTGVPQVSQAAQCRPESDQLVLPDEIDRLVVAHAGRVDDLDVGKVDEAVEVIFPPDPCPTCGTLELWQSMAGNWRCQRCDPPTRWREFQARTSNTSSINKMTS